MKIPSMKQASTRAMTFLNYSGAIIIQTLVTWGLFYTGKARDLQCYYCGHVFAEWKEKDSAKFRHLQEFPSCEHFQQVNKRDNYEPDRSTINTQRQSDNFSLPYQGAVGRRQNDVNLSPQGLTRGQDLDQPDCAGPLYQSLPPQPKHMFLRDQLQQERQTDLRTQAGRLSTFTDWPKHDIINPEELALAGFKYLGSEDRVQCVFCKGILKNWQLGDRALDEHRKFFNACPYLESLGDGIVQRSGLTLTQDSLTPKPKPKPKVTEGTLKAIGITPTAENNLENMDTTSLGVVTARAKYPLHSVHERRVESFNSDEWKKQALPQTPDDFGKAGLFYTGPKDRVRCFFCGGGMEEWSIHDTPMEEHKRWYPDCPYLEQLDNEKMHHLSSQLGATSLGAEGGTEVPKTPVKPEETPEGQILKEMGYDSKLINSTFNKLLQQGKQDIKASDLLDMIFKDEESTSSILVQEDDCIQAKEEKKQDTHEYNVKQSQENKDVVRNTKDNLSLGQFDFPRKPKKDDLPNIDPELKKARDENTKLRKMFYCWSCEDRLLSNILFLPCSHMTLCEGCYKGNQGHVSCPRCKGVVRGIVKTFTS